MTIMTTYQNAVLYESWFDEQARQKREGLEMLREARNEAYVTPLSGSENRS